MQTLRILTLALLGLAGISAQAHGGNWTLGFSVGGPVRPRPYYGHHHVHPYRYYGGYYYRPYPAVIVQPAPVVYQPAPLVVQQPAPVIQQPTYHPAPVPASVVSRSVVSEAAEEEIARNLQQLANPDERTRMDSVLALGRMKAYRAIDPLAATLAGDRSPAVREAAARALGLIGSPKGLPALQQAALADSDPSVRHTAQFAADVIQSHR